MNLSLDLEGNNILLKLSLIIKFSQTYKTLQLILTVGFYMLE